MAKIAFYAYYFPPQISAGSQRPARMVKMLQEIGHDVTVFTNKASGERLDNSQFPVGQVNNQIIEVVDPVEVFLQYIPNLLRKIINYIAIPDVKIFHAIRVYKNVRNSDFDIIITTSAPLSSHIVGLLLTKKMIWIADVRDSIVNNPSMKIKRIKPAEYFAGKILNRLIDKKSTITLTASKTISEDYRRKNFTFYNGFYDENQWIKKNISNKFFIIGYVGSLYAERDPDIFLSGFKQFLQSLSHDEKKIIKLQFIGNNDIRTQKKLANFPNSIQIEILPYIEKIKLFDIANSWAILLLLVDDVPFSQGVVTGKLFDYLCMNGRVLAIAPKNSEIKDILFKTNKGRVIPKTNVNEISEYLLQNFRKWQCGKLAQLETNHIEINKFSYSEQKIYLQNILKDLFLHES